MHNFQVYWISLYMFRRSFRPSSGVQDCTHSIRYMSYSLVDCLLAGTRWNWPLYPMLPVVNMQEASSCPWTSLVRRPALPRWYVYSCWFRVTLLLYDYAQLIYCFFRVLALLPTPDSTGHTCGIFVLRNLCLNFLVCTLLSHNRILNLSVYYPSYLYFRKPNITLCHCHYE